MNSLISKEEKRQHSTVLVPYSTYHCRIPDLFVNVPIHYHNEFELNYITEGNGEVICGDNKYLVKQGDILFYPSNMLHGAYPCNKSKFHYDAFVFSSRLLSADCNDRCTIECIHPLINGTSNINTYISQNSNHYQEINCITKHIFQYAMQNEARSDLMLKSELLHLIWLLESEVPDLKHIETNISFSELVRPALTHIATNYSDTISIDSLASISNLSKSYFMFCFKRAAGVSANKYISQLRIHDACESLRLTQTSIAEISYQCGYNNLSNFNRQFKQAIGFTPLQYRKRYSKK